MEINKNCSWYDGACATGHGESMSGARSKIDYCFNKHGFTYQQHRAAKTRLIGEDWRQISFNSESVLFSFLFFFFSFFHHFVIFLNSNVEQLV